MRSTTFRLAGLAALAAAILGAAACGGSGADSGGDDDGGSLLGSVKPAENQAADQVARAGATASKGAESLSTNPQPPTTGAPSSSSSGGGGLPVPSANAASLERKIIFTANLALNADDVANSFNEVGRIARTAGGFVEKSSLAQRTPGADGIERQFGSLTIRIPADQYQDVLASLRALPGTKLDKEDSGSNEVTEEYADLQSRLRNLERSEAQFLKLLEQAKTIQEIITVNDRIDGVRGQIEQVQGRLKVYDDLTDLATISVSLTPVIPGKATPKADGPKAFSEAFADAWDWSVEALRYGSAAGAVVIVGAIWLAIPLALAVGGIRLAGRRRGGTTA